MHLREATHVSLPRVVSHGCHSQDTHGSFPWVSPVGASRRSHTTHGMHPRGYAAFVFQLHEFDLDFWGTDAPDLDVSVIRLGSDLIQAVISRYIKKRVEFWRRED